MWTKIHVSLYYPFLLMNRKLVKTPKWLTFGTLVISSRASRSLFAFRCSQNSSAVKLFKMLKTFLCSLFTQTMTLCFYYANSLTHGAPTISESRAEFYCTVCFTMSARLEIIFLRKGPRGTTTVTVALKCLMATDWLTPMFDLIECLSSVSKFAICHHLNT